MGLVRKLRRAAIRALIAAVLSAAALGHAIAAPAGSEDVMKLWYRLVLELVRHTPTYTPPVASRTLAYLGVTAFEARVGAGGDLVTLAGQLNGLDPLPMREPGTAYAEPVVMQAALSAVVNQLFANTGPTGQRALAAVDRQLDRSTAEGAPPDVVARSQAYGAALAGHILAWSATDGGARIENMGFPLTYAAATGPGKWSPTSKIALQQAPLLPEWGRNRPFAMPEGNACPLPAPTVYSEEEGSAFWNEAREVYDIKKALTPEQLAIARFWSDDAMLSQTPPGHWIAIAGQVMATEGADADRMAEVYAKLGVGLADAFVGCWYTKFEYDTLRPVTYIRRFMDKKWESLLTTPPFPEYPSGHSTQSAAAAVVLTAMFGEGYAFDDASHTDDGMPARHFGSFEAAAEEAGISRLYGGIHFRTAIERGLEQGRCIGAFAARLKTRG